MAVCCYFAFFFMSGYKYRQSRAVLKRLVSVVNVWSRSVCAAGPRKILGALPTLRTSKYTGTA